MSDSSSVNGLAFDQTLRLHQLVLPDFGIADLGESVVGKVVAEMNATIEAIRAANAFPGHAIAESLRFAELSGIGDSGIGKTIASLFGKIGALKFPPLLDEGIISRFNQELGLLRTRDFSMGALGGLKAVLDGSLRPTLADTVQELMARANEHSRVVSCFQPLDMGMSEFNALHNVSELALYRALALDEENRQFPDFLAETAALISEEDGGEVIYETNSFFDRRILTSGINISLFNAIKRNPEKVYKMTPREFEEFVAEVFLRRGFEVRLTPQSNDGGYDIVAVWNNDLTGKEVHLVECKRYAAERKISVGVVRGLHGVVHDADATKGILVTTSGFSKQARDFEQRHRGRIKLQDYDALVGWIRALR